ncbi:MAG TPA: epoxide hydrolase [Rhodothermales bacterium]
MHPFRIQTSDALLHDLAARLARTRLPDAVEGAGWDYGTDRDYLQELIAYWRSQFDWYAQEEALNEIPQFVAEIYGLAIHFIHVRGKGDRPLPLVVTHGWPSTCFEMRRLIGPLTDPVAHGGNPGDAFDLVIPSLPGFGYSAKPTKRGFVRVDRLWRTLMTEVLGYPRFVAHGTDIGARVTSALGRFHEDVVTAIHLGSVDLDWPEPLPPESELSDAERDYLARVRHWEATEGAYAEIQATRPQTLTYGLHDSPVGLAAWIVEKFRAWSDCAGDVESRFSKDELLTNISIYWLTGTIGSSMRRYFEVRHGGAPHPLMPGERIEVPTGVAMFPGEKELLVPREFAERCYRIERWTDMPRGGHFPAIEEPELLIEDLRAFFRPFRDL